MVVETEMYPVAKDPDVLKYIKDSPASAKDKLIDAIDALQFDPFPAGSVTATFAQAEITRLTVETNPRSQLLYIVDKTSKKVFVMSVMELRFS